VKSSIGTTTPDTDADRDVDGIPDQAERDFAEDGQSTPTPTGRTPRPARGSTPDGAPDDGGLESTRPPHGDVVPPPSN